MKKNIKKITTISAMLVGFGLLMTPALWSAVDQAAGAVKADAAANMKSGPKRISVDFQNADMPSVLKVLALKGDVNIVASPDVVGKVNIQLKDVPWAHAFETIVETYGFAYEKKGNIYQIMTLESMNQRPVEPYLSEVVTLQHTSITEVTDALGNSFASSLTIEAVAGTNQIIISDTTSNLDRVKEVITKIDRKMPQVEIKTEIVRTALTKGEKLGVDWNAVAQITGAKRPTTFPFSPDPANRRFDKFLQRFDTLPIGQTIQETTTTVTDGGGSTAEATTEFPVAHGFPFVQPDDFTFGTLDFSQFTAVFNAIKNRKSTKIVSNPRIVVLNHQNAEIQVGEEIGIPTLERNESTGSFEVTGFESRNTGIVLNVNPHITEDGEVWLRVRPEVTKFVGFVPITDTNLTSPRFETVVAETTVRVKDGDTIVIGGLISEDDSNTRSKVPLLGRIPVVGWLFKHRAPQKTRAETIFFITVNLADKAHNKQQMKNWQKTMDEYETHQKEVG